jgi:hypothetical protein
MSESVPIHPVAPRLKDGPKKPHVGPTIGDYKALHTQSIGPGSDEYWTKASRNTVNIKTDDHSPMIAFLKGRSRDATLGQALHDCPDW